MCGRFTRFLTWSQVVALYRLTDDERRLNLGSRANICPTDDVLVVRERDGRREAAMVRWWLVPPWAKDLSATFSMFNARAETLGERKAYAEPLRHRRCLIPASGFYEWKSEGRRKTRYYFTTRSGAPLTFAGLWERNERLNVESCTIIVTAPNAVTSPIHDRMPAILAPEDWDAWLREPRIDLLRPAPAGDLIAYPVPSDIKDEDAAETLAAGGGGLNV